MSFVKVLNIPDNQNVYFVGDIHGNYDLYNRTLREFGITDNDVVISVGDVIDRGNKNARCLFEFLLHENRHMVLGNHEDMMVRSYSTEEHVYRTREWYHVWQQNGGNTTLDEIGEPGIKHFCTLLKEVPHVLEVNHRGYKILVSHAAIPNLPNVNSVQEIITFAEEDGNYRHQLIWDRDAINYARHDYDIPENEKMQRIIEGADYVIHGHTGVPHKFLFGNRVWIDTQFMSGELTLAYMNDEHELEYLTREKDEYSFMYRGK